MNSRSDSPSATYDVAIAEQHAVTFAAGLAAEGLKPVVAIYSTFLQRAYDQLIHDVALQNLPVIFALDRAGLVGSDGATHQGSYDLTFLRCIPNMVIMAPADENECRQMLYTATTLSSPSAVRYPRGTGPGACRRGGNDGAARGPRSSYGAKAAAGSRYSPSARWSTPARKIAERLDATLVNMRFIKPLDEKLVLTLAARHRAIVTIEENAIIGGAGCGRRRTARRQWACSCRCCISAYRTASSSTVRARPVSRRRASISRDSPRASRTGGRRSLRSGFARSARRNAPRLLLHVGS